MSGDPASASRRLMPPRRSIQPYFPQSARVWHTVNGCKQTAVLIGVPSEAAVHRAMSAKRLIRQRTRKASCLITSLSSGACEKQDSSSAAQ